MRPVKQAFAVIAALILVTIVVLGRQHQAAINLRDEIDQRHAQSRERAQLEEEHRRLIAAQPTVGELIDVLASQSVAEQLRSKLAALRRREEAASRAVAGQPVLETKPTVLSLTGNRVAAERWQNAGQATPDAAFQTTLWAAAGGDLDSLTDLLAFDAEAKSQATVTFDRLPAAVQNELGTPERLMALLTAVDVPLGSAVIFGQQPTSAGAMIDVQLTDADGNSKMAMFSLQADGERWRLIVPSAVVRKYAGWLHAPSGAAGDRAR